MKQKDTSLKLSAEHFDIVNKTYDSRWWQINIDLFEQLCILLVFVFIYLILFYMIFFVLFIWQWSLHLRGKVHPNNGSKMPPENNSATRSPTVGGQRLMFSFNLSPACMSK